jgi:methyltransferase
LTIVQRLWELKISNQHQKDLMIKGAVVVEELNYKFMVLLHSFWLGYLLINSFFEREYQIFYFAFGLGLFVLGQSLRFMAMKTLGERWTTRIVVLPEAPLIQKSLYKYIKHPNYLGVILEIAALPLMMSDFKATLIFSLINLLILFFRVKKEEASLGIK